MALGLYPGCAGGDDIIQVHQSISDEESLPLTIYPIFKIDTFLKDEDLPGRLQLRNERRERGIWGGGGKKGVRRKGLGVVSTDVVDVAEGTETLS